ncbi:hypothetical protein H0H92_005110 [Tricholoma furcatifolium]|nr:hypothetical protein H0H92_005110 [Tricholoma furcatifolium]
MTSTQPTTLKPQSIVTPSSVIHLEYDPATVPPVPSPSWTRFVCISDTHTRMCDVPAGDVLLHAGDLTNRGLLSEFEATAASSLETMISHCIQNGMTVRMPDSIEALAPILDLLTGPRAREAGLIYLQDASYEFQLHPNGRKWSVYGSPSLSRLTHGPPAGIFDITRGNNNVGCEDLRARLPHLRPRLHVFGHIHEARGAYTHSWGSSSEPSPLPMFQNTEDNVDEQDAARTDIQGGTSDTNVEIDNGTVFVNAALTPAGHRALRGAHRVPFGGPGFQPIIVDLLD